MMSVVLLVLAQASDPELVSVRKIWDRAPHNAFTDLLRFRDRWICAFREAEGHVGGDGKVRLLDSADGEAWESAGLVGEEGIDLRDPKLSVTPDGRLMIVAGGSVYRGGKKLLGRRPRVAFSKDGRSWTAPEPVLSEGEWLWRVTWHDGRAYGAAYNASEKPEWKLRLYSSADGAAFDLVTPLDVPGHPNETTLRFAADGGMIALVRREAGNATAWIGASPPPYKEWKWQETKHRVGGPNFLIRADGSMWAGGRSYPGGARTALARLTRESYEPALTLPSGGDTSYPGLVLHEGLLWMSYYSSHEGKSSIYLAKVKLP